MVVDDKIEEIRDVVRRGRAMPISASCLVNRKELLGALDELAALVPTELTRAQEILADRDAVIEDGRREAERIVEAERSRREEILADTDVHREARESADAVRAEAQGEAEALRREVDDYVDHKLASFEIALTKTLSAIERGQERASGVEPPAAPAGEEAGEEIEALREGADDYIRMKFERFESALTKTLEVVSRGRERLRNRSGLDEFGTGLAADDEAEPLPGD